jgi:hypothetical protein
MAESFRDSPTEGAGVRRNVGPAAAVMITAILMAGNVSFVASPTAQAQDHDQIVSELEANG